MFKQILTMVIIFIATPILAAQVEVIEPEKQLAKVVIIKDSDGKNASKAMVLKKRLENELGIKLKLEKQAIRKELKRYIADREITPNEQESFLTGLSLEQKKRVIFVPSVPTKMRGQKMKTKIRNNSKR